VTFFSRRSTARVLLASERVFPDAGLVRVPIFFARAGRCSTSLVRNAPTG
jgi:hypothetical protein